MDTASPSNAGMDVEDVGAKLRAARERRGISLDELARLTKIRPSLLAAIETNRRDALPTTIFLRGFVHAYAREVRLNPDETSHAYLSQFAAAEPAAEDAAAAAGTPAPPVEPPRDRTRLRNVAIVAALGVVLIVYGIAHRSTPPPVASETTAAAPAQAAPTVPRREVATSGSSTPAVVGAAGRVLHVDLETTGVCWVSANVDGARVTYQLLQPGERRSLTVKDAVALRVGEPSALTVRIDGAVARPLGAAGQPTTVRITPENYREFLR